jgi:6,7-dimethyl-8-ribityllumazine synthase
MAGRAPRRVRSSHPAPHDGAGRPRGDRRFAIVAGRFNEPITQRLVDGAQRAFEAAGMRTASVDVYWVPGSFELPQAAQRLADTRRYAGIVCVGVVIRGQTPHFEHVAREAAAGIRDVGLRTGVPVTFGVITALDEAQAWQRAGGDVGNRGEEAADAAIEMAELYATLAKRFGERGPARRRSR